MAATLIQSEFVYRSGTPPEQYQFTIVQNEVGAILVRDMQDPYGFVISPYTQIPQSVTDDIQSAMAQVEALLSLTSAVNGTFVFAAETSKSHVFTAPFPNADYRVQLTSDVFVPLRISAKTVTGFTVEAGASFSGEVGFDVLV